MQPITLRIQKDCALGETVQAEIHVDPKDLVKGEQVFNRVADILDRRLVALNYRVMEAMKLEQRYGPEGAAQARAVVEVLLGQKSLAEFERTKDLAPTTAEQEARAAEPTDPPTLQVIDGGRK